MRSASVFGLVVTLASGQGMASPPSEMDFDAIRVKCVDENGKAVVPDRIACEVIYYPPLPGYGPLMEECQGWQYVLNPGSAPVEYRPFEFRPDGTGTINLPRPFGAHHGLGVPQVAFLRAVARNRPSAPLILATPEYPPKPEEVLTLTFHSKSGLPPRIVEPPRMRLRPDPRARVHVPVELSVKFEDPDGDALQLRWLLPRGKAEHRHAASTRASLPLTEQLIHVLACDPKGNCTTASATMHPRVSGDDAPWFPDRTAPEVKIEHFPRLQKPAKEAKRAPK